MAAHEEWRLRLRPVPRVLSEIGSAGAELKARFGGVAQDALHPGAREGGAGGPAQADGAKRYSAPPSGASCHTTVTGMPGTTSAGSHPTTLVMTRGPSASSTYAST